MQELIKNNSINIPEYVKNISEKVNQASHEVYLVGGCVRDFLMSRKPNDWDLTTNALPEQILKIFPEAKYENTFGTVLIPVQLEKKRIAIEITTYRSEQGYNDHRRPDEVKFETKLDKDLERRDFTVNAMALDITKEKHKLVDLFGGQKDINLKIIRAVGEPSDRFREDALRMIRAIRFACQLKYNIETKTLRGITKLAGSIKFIAFERIGEEFTKILKSTNPSKGIKLMHETKLLQYILPELTASCGIAQNHHHKDDVYTHCLMSLHHCPSKDWRVKFAALLHDIGKPKTKKFINNAATFYNHEYVSEKMARKICKRLKFSTKDTDKITNLVRNHMFYYDSDEVTESSVRRLIKKVGKENLKDLIDLRIGDRLGSGVAKGKPYKLRHLEYVMEKVQNDPVSVKMLKINGNDLMSTFNMPPGPKIGTILDILLSEVIENPTLNTLEHLEQRARELDSEDIIELRKKAKAEIEEKRNEDDQKIKKQHWVK